jgi:hypothetical protein
MLAALPLLLPLPLPLLPKAGSDAMGASGCGGGRLRLLLSLADDGEWQLGGAALMGGMHARGPGAGCRRRDPRRPAARATCCSGRPLAERRARVEAATVRQVGYVCDVTRSFSGGMTGRSKAAGPGGSTTGLTEGGTSVEGWES